MPALTGLPTLVRHIRGATAPPPGNHARRGTGPRCLQVCGVSGKPWTSTANGSAALSICPNVSGRGRVTCRAYYIDTGKRKYMLLYITMRRM